MSEPQPVDVLTSAAQGELRHAMRTPFNALLGYTDMLLETASEDGLDALIPALGQINAESRELLNRVNEALAAERGVGVSQLRTLGAQVQERLPGMAGQIASTLDLGRELASDACDVLRRLQKAAEQLDELVCQHLLVSSLPTAFDAAAAAASAEGAEQVKEAAQGRSPPARASGKVFVVDDSESNRDLLCRRLEREGYTAATASNGREALERLRTESFDLLLLDLLMPEVGGYDVLRTMKGTAAWRDIPVIMISALDEMASVVRCIEAGAEDYLPKPFDPVLLRARVGACLEKKRLRDMELEYLRGVQALEEAAEAVESGTFAEEKLQVVAGRQDELGKLARVFQHMASEIQAREQKLKREVAQLRIEIDMVKLSQQVSEVTSSEMFTHLEGARERFKRRREGG